jgi:hypothetical protein
MKLTRRGFVGVGAAVLGTRLLAGDAGAKRPPRILLRGSWQSVNIGDIGHTPGALDRIRRHFPEAEVTLWPSELGHGAQEFLLQAFPRLKIARGGLKDGKPDTPELERAWADNDVMVHGSSAGFGARAQLAAWHRATGKPYGAFGVTLDPVSGFGANRNPEGGTLVELRARVERLPPTHLDKETRAIIDGASFMFLRETITRDYLKAQGVKPAILEFGPDAQFGMQLRDDVRGDAYRRANGLEEGKFICVIPRLRYTPYYRIKNLKRVPADDVRDAINERTVDRDHARLRDMIVAYVRNTGNKVMACAEMTYQVQMAKDVLVDPLPADVKRNVVWRDTYWLPDEAASIYSKALAVISVECHSPIISLAHGTPAFYVRQPTDTCKGQMYRDIGSDWFFEIEETTGEQLWARLKAVHADPIAARARVKAIMTGVDRLQQRMVDALRSAVGRTP